MLHYVHHLVTNFLLLMFGAGQGLKSEFLAVYSQIDPEESRNKLKDTKSFFI